MATSVVKLYHGTNLHPWMLTANKFFVIDDIASYLSTYSESCITLNNFQYQKCSLEMAIVCDLSQHNSEPLYSNGIKYVSIQNSDGGKTYYFYVKKAEWRAKQSVKLLLVMDVANTFRSGNDFDFTEKTKITREHKDRFIQTPFIRKFYFNYSNSETQGTIPHTLTVFTISIYGANAELLRSFTCKGRDIVESDVVEISKFNEEDAEWLQSYSLPSFPVIRIDYSSSHFAIIDLPKTSVGFDYGYNLTRKIDYQSEGLTPILYKKSEQEIRRSSILDVDWYLLYRNQNDPTDALTNPVHCYLIPSVDTPVNLGSIQSGGRINPDNLEVGKFYYIPLYYHQLRTITLSTGVVISASSGTSDNSCIIVQKVDESHLIVNTTTWENVGGQGYLKIATPIVCEYFNVSALPTNYKITTSINQSYSYAAFTSDTFPNSWTSEGETPLTLDGIDKVDRTDAKNIKLIKFPYIPYDLNVVDGKLIITDTDFEHVSLAQSGGGIIEVLKLKNLNVKFNYDFNCGLSPFNNLVFLKPTITTTTLRMDNLESKVFHSDYYQPKFVYDSFGYVFQLERMSTDYISQIEDLDDMKIKYVVSTTINSKFMFQFIEYQSDMGKEDYNNVMPVARNNELVLYNVPYINYIRTGYNYDVKNKNTQMASTWTSVGLSGLSMGVALAFPSTALKVAGVVASLVSTAVSIKNAAVSQVEAERSLNQKTLEAKNQSTSVSGSDDVDLMSVYTNNRAKLCTYECSDIMKNLLYDLFFYTGYISNRMGMPNTHTRRNFDYLEADIIITDHTNMSDEIMDELVGLYKNGLTFIHKVEGRTDMWDLEQKYENIEISMLE